MLTFWFLLGKWLDCETAINFHWKFFSRPNWIDEIFQTLCLTAAVEVTSIRGVWGNEKRTEWRSPMGQIFHHRCTRTWSFIRLLGDIPKRFSHSECFSILLTFRPKIFSLMLPVSKDKWCDTFSTTSFSFFSHYTLNPIQKVWEKEEIYRYSWGYHTSFCHSAPRMRIAKSKKKACRVDQQQCYQEILCIVFFKVKFLDT